MNNNNPLPPPPSLNPPHQQLHDALSSLNDGPRLIELLYSGVELLLMQQQQHSNNNNNNINTTTTTSNISTTTNNTTSTTISPPSPDTIISFPDVSISNPRGSFIVDFCMGKIMLRGKGKIFEINKNQIIRMVILPGDGKTSCNMILLETTGETPSTTITSTTTSSTSSTPLIPKFILATPKLKSNQPPISLCPDENALTMIIQSQQQQKQQRRDECFEHLCISSLTITRICRPDVVNVFKSFKGGMSIPCHVQNVKEGYLWFLKEGLCFTQSPTLFLDICEMSSLQIEAVTPKTFTLKVVMVNNNSTTAVHEFSGIDITERNLISEYISRVRGWSLAAQKAEEKRQNNNKNKGIGGSNNTININDDGDDIGKNDGESTESSDEDDDDEDDEDDSLYVSSNEDDSSSSNDDDNDNDDDNNNGNEQQQQDDHDSGNKSDDESSDSSPSSSSSDDELDDDVEHEVAELVEEEEFVAETDAILPSRKRVRRE
jgi:hypothetical protein